MLREFKLLCREAGPSHHLDAKVDSDQHVVNESISLSLPGVRGDFAATSNVARRVRTPRSPPDDPNPECASKISKLDEAVAHPLNLSLDCRPGFVLIRHARKISSWEGRCSLLRPLFFRSLVLPSVSHHVNSRTFFLFFFITLQPRVE